MKLYCLSGLGADERVFEPLHLQKFEIVPIPWLTPHKKESFQHYCQRLFISADIEENYSLLGLSFGGMVAQEFAKIQPPKQLFLVSSLTSWKDQNFFFRYWLPFPLVRWIPNKILLSPNPFLHWFFGVHTKKEKNVINQIIRTSDPVFLKWAISSLRQFKPSIPDNYFCIHGEKDRLLKMPLNPDLKLPGGHFTILSHSYEIGQFIDKKAII